MESDQTDSLELIRRGSVEIIDEEELKDKLIPGKASEDQGRF